MTTGTAAPMRERECDLVTLGRLAKVGQLYAVADAAGKADVYATLVEAGDAAVSLYSGAVGDLYAGIAPWLVRVDGARLDWINTTLAEDPGWGVFVIARAERDQVRRQLRRLLTVRLPDRTLVRFRFYDPRVLGPFLGTCTAEELDFVFGVLDAYATVTSGTQRVRVWDRAGHPALLPRPLLRVAASLTPTPSAAQGR